MRRRHFKDMFSFDSEFLANFLGDFPPLFSNDIANLNQENLRISAVFWPYSDASKTHF